MAKTISKQINQQYLPTIVGGYPVYAYGGKLYWGGGMMATDVQMQNIQAASQGVGPYAQQGLSQGASMGLNVAGQGMQDIANGYRPDKPNYGANIGGGALKGAATGAAIGSLVPIPGIGTVAGGIIGGIGGALGGLTKSIGKAGQIKYQEEQTEQQALQQQKQQSASNLPGTPQYTPTFAMGGKMYQDGGKIQNKSKVLPEITVYSKHKYIDELNKQQQKYLADMAKYKQDSAQWIKANKAYQDSLNLYNTENATREFNKKYWDWIDYGDTESVRDVLVKAVKGNPDDRFRGQIHHGGITYGFHDGSQEKDGKYKKEDIHWTKDNKQEHITTMLKNSNIKPIGFKPILEYGTEYNPNIIYNYSPVYKKPTKPKSPLRPNNTKVTYDDTYENLNMRPLWANIAKQDSSQNIGTLYNLDPQYKKRIYYWKKLLELFHQKLK